MHARPPEAVNPHNHVPTEPSQLEYEAVAALRAGLRRFLHATHRITRAHGLTAQRYDLLAVVRGSDSAALSVREVAALLSLAPHSATELVDRAEEAGLVERLSDDRDRRARLVALTDAGEARLAAAVVALRPERRRLLGLLADVYAQAQRL